MPDEFDGIVALVSKVKNPAEWVELNDEEKKSITINGRIASFIKKGEAKAIDRVYERLTKTSRFSVYLDNEMGESKESHKTTDAKRDALEGFIRNMAKKAKDKTDQYALFAREIGDLYQDPKNPEKGANFKKADGTPSNALVLYACLLYLRRFENPKLSNPEVLWNEEFERPSVYVERLYKETQAVVAPGTKPKTTLDIAMDAFNAGDKKTFEATIKENAKKTAVLSDIFLTIYSVHVYPDVSFRKFNVNELEKLEPGKNYTADVAKLKIVNAARQFLELKKETKLAAALDTALLTNLFSAYVKTKKEETKTVPVQPQQNTLMPRPF